MENNQNGQGLEEGYFEDNFKPMFEQQTQQQANEWDMSDVPPMGEQQQDNTQENQANQGNQEKRPKAKSAIAKALFVAVFVAGTAAGSVAFTVHQDKLVDQELKNPDKFKNATEQIDDIEKARAIEEDQENYDKYNIELPE